MVAAGNEAGGDVEAEGLRGGRGGRGIVTGVLDRDFRLGFSFKKIHAG